MNGFLIGVVRLVAGLILVSSPLRAVADGITDDVLASAAAQALSDNQSASPQRTARGRDLQGVYKARIEPHWFNGSTKFWYRNDLRAGAKEFVLVDAASGERKAAFDHERLAASLSQAAQATYDAKQLPFDRIEFANNGEVVRFVVGDSQWECKLDSYDCTELGPAPENRDTDDEATSDRGTRRDRWQFLRGFGREGGGQSPDGKWTAYVRDHNVYIRPAGEANQSDNSTRVEFQLSTDGREEARYGMLQWAPDSQTLVAFRIEPGDRKEVFLVESSPSGGGRAKLRRRTYDLPGDKLTSYELTLFRVEDKKRVRPAVEKIDLHYPRIYWNRDGRHFAYEKVDRGHQRLRLIDIDSHTGESKSLIDETSNTFIWTAHAENLNLERINWLPNSDEAIYVSERDGWRHLYLVDTHNGGIKNQITSGEYVVRGIDHIDAEKQHVWFRASGRHADQDPYFVHYYRVNFDGTGLTSLTEANGHHAVQFSPDRKYVVDTYSRVDMPPKHELRRTDNGTLVCALEEADATELLEHERYHPLESFVAKGRDGQTDIWGVICRPRGFDPAKKYPVLESIYAGPQGSFVPKSFGAGIRYAAMADLGFIVVQIDGMGTANRSKAFHDVCWHNLKDAGLPDRILWIEAAAEKYPYMDTSRVGIYGGSAGGQNAAAAVLFHPEFYQVAVAGCGCHDNRMDKASWNEQWMGYPVGPQYAECSNIENADRLAGKLMLIVGELDDNVPTESTYRFADALIKAGKDFDLIVVPGAGHGMGGEYGERRMRDFFVRHLLGTEPPDRNGKTPLQIAGQDEENRRPASASDENIYPRLDLATVEPRSPIAAAVERFRSDQANLRRYYVVEQSPQARARWRKFYTDWLAAVLTLPDTAITPGDRVAHGELKSEILDAFTRAELAAQRRAGSAEFVPFAPTIIQLAEERREVKKMDSPKAAEIVEKLSRDVNTLRETLDERLKSRTSSDETLSGEHLDAAAESVGELRGYLRGWYRFYDGYDPLFSWWLRAPYRDADAALSKYADLLEEPPAPAAEIKTASVSASAASQATPGDASSSLGALSEAGDVPNLTVMINQAPSRMEPIVLAFRSEFPPMGPWSGGRDRGRANPRSRGRQGPRANEQVEDNQRNGDDDNDDGRDDEDRRDQDSVGDDTDPSRTSAREGRRRSRQISPERRERQKNRLAEWSTALEALSFEELSQSDRVDFLLLKNHIAYRQRKLAAAQSADDDDGDRPIAVDVSGIKGRPIGREALRVELNHELIPYSPEQLIEIAARENAWCQAELLKASREMGFGDDWQKAVEKVKTMHVPPGEQPYMIRELAWEAIDYLRKHNLVTVPPLAAETWGLQMMTPERQLVNPFFTGGNEISVSFPTDTMSHEQKLQSMRGNNIPFSRATVHHELIPGHNLQFFMGPRHKPYRRQFATPFWGEGWALYWEMLLYERGFPQTPEDRVGFLVWRKHRCARIVFSLSFHLGRMRPQECVDYLVANVGFEPNNAAAEVRRSFEEAEPLYQAAYMLGGLQFRALRAELIGTGRMSDREFHDAILQEGNIPVVMVRALLNNQSLTKQGVPEWRFGDALSAAERVANPTP